MRSYSIMGSSKNPIRTILSKSISRHNSRSPCTGDRPRGRCCPIVCLLAAQDFLVSLAQVSPYDPAHVRSLASEALPPSMVFTPRGVDDTAFRITRLV